MSLSRASKAALRQADAEGLTLLKSEDNSTGYKCVCKSSHKSKLYQAQVWRGGKTVTLGYFATAEEAALSIARTPEAQAAAAAPPEPPPLTVDEALRQAETEGLTLLQAESTVSGYKGVFFDSSNRSKPYLARVQRGGKPKYVGSFVTAEEAALCVARTPEARAAAAAAAAPPPPPPLTVEEALQQAEAEGLTLLRSESSNSGFKCVRFKSGNRMKPYKAELRRGGQDVTLGLFATAEEAALCYARTPEAQAAVVAAAAAPPEPPPMTAEEALRQAETEGLTLLKSDNATGFKGVCFKSGKSKPYQAKVKRGGMQVHLGYYATPEEAALSIARTPESQAAAAARVPERPPLTVEEVLRQVETEGLALLRSEDAISGFRGVTVNSSRNRAKLSDFNKSKPYEAKVYCGGKAVYLGIFATAEEAALHVARASAAQAAAPQPPATSSRKRKVRSKEQPPDMPADVVVILEGRFVGSTTFE